MTPAEEARAHAVVPCPQCGEPAAAEDIHPFLKDGRFPMCLVCYDATMFSYHIHVYTEGKPEGEFIRALEEARRRDMCPEQWRAHAEALEMALQSIASNTCCTTCREAALVAQAALARLPAAALAERRALEACAKALSRLDTVIRPAHVDMGGKHTWALSNGPETVEIMHAVGTALAAYDAARKMG